jgi:hypothetical protein
MSEEIIKPRGHHNPCALIQAENVAMMEHIIKLQPVIDAQLRELKQQAAEIKVLRELNLDLQDQVRLLNAHIASLEYDWDVIKETITTLTHARAFITSKLISMHPDGVALYDENIETLKLLIREGSE